MSGSVMRRGGSSVVRLLLLRLTMVDGPRELEGVTVTAVKLLSPNFDLALEFEGSLVLQTFRSSTEEDAWSFYSPEGSFVLDPNGVFRFEPPPSSNS